MCAGVRGSSLAGSAPSSVRATTCAPPQHVVGASVKAALSTESITTKAASLKAKQLLTSCDEVRRAVAHAASRARRRWPMGDEEQPAGLFRPVRPTASGAPEARGRSVLGACLQKGCCCSLQAFGRWRCCNTHAACYAFAWLRRLGRARREETRGGGRAGPAAAAAGTPLCSAQLVCVCACRRGRRGWRRHWRGQRLSARARRVSPIPSSDCGDTIRAWCARPTRAAAQGFTESAVPASSMALARAFLVAFNVPS